MITVIRHRDDSIEFISDYEFEDHIVLVDAKENWTNSPEKWTLMNESEQAEFLAALRNEDNFQDRNP